MLGNTNNIVIVQNKIISLHINITIIQKQHNKRKNNNITLQNKIQHTILIYKITLYHYKTA